MPPPPCASRNPEPTRVNSPSSDRTFCSTSRCASCGWWTISEIDQMPAHGTSTAVSRFSQFLALSLASASSMIARNAGSFALRVGQSAKRGSASASSRPSPFIRLANCRSVITASIRSPSPALKRLPVTLPVLDRLPNCRWMWPATVYSATWPRQKRQRRVEHRHVDELPRAGDGALVERARDREGRGHRADRVAQREACAGRDLCPRGR